MRLHMRDIVIKNYVALKKILTSPEMFAKYKAFSGPYTYTRLKVSEYPHTDGAYIEEKRGRYWVYVSIMHGKRKIYDVALHKLLNRYPDLRKRLVQSGVIRVENNETVTVPV